MGFISGGVGRLRDGARQCVERRRLQAAHARHFVNQRFVEERDAGHGVWVEIVLLLQCGLGRELTAPAFFVGTNKIKTTTEGTEDRRAWLRLKVVMYKVVYEWASCGFE